MMRLKDLVKNASLSEVKQVREIVPVEDWVEDYYYSGVVTRMYPFWKEKIVEVFRKGVDEVIVIGSLGGGKTTFANALLMRKIYELSCFEPIAGLFNLLRGTVISFMYFSVSLQQALRTGYGMLMRMIDEAPYFQKVFRRDTDINSVVRFNGIEVYPGSIVEHQIGLALLGAVLDEANFLQARDPYEKAKEVYTAIINRRKSRFIVKGKDVGLSVLVSSAEEPSSFVEDRIAKVGNSENVLVVSSVAFELKRKQYSGDMFVVFIGSEFIRPRVVDGVEDLVEVLRYFKVSEEVLNEVRKWPVRYSVRNLLPREVAVYFKEVPVEFRRAFEDDVVRAVRDVLGVSVGSENKLFRSFVAYEDALEGRNAFRVDVVRLSSKDERRLQEWFDFGVIERPELPRYVHVDLGVKEDRTGIACVYVNGVKETDLGNLPIVRVDFMAGIEREVVYGDDEVPIWKIRDFLLWLREKGLNVVKVSFDSFQSLDMIQLLQKRGFKVEKLSVDRTDEQYLNLVTLYLERRIRHPENVVYRRELFGLEWDRVKRKVDHPTGGTKDVADAVAGAVWWAVNEWKEGVYDLAYGSSEVKMEFGGVVDEWVVRALKDRNKGIESWEDFFKQFGKSSRKKFW